MLLVNGELLDVRKTDDERVKWYTTEKNKIIKRKEPFVLIKEKGSFMFDDKRNKIIPPTISISTKSTMNSTRGTEEWVWCKSYKKNTVGAIDPTPSHIRIADKFTLNNETDAEQIFFLTCVKNLAKHGYRISDPEGEAGKRNEKISIEADIRYLIYGKHSPLALDVDKARYIAKAWGVGGADVLGQERLKEQLFNAVSNSEKNKASTGRGFSEFVDDVEGLNEDRLKARVVVSEALKEGHIVYDAASGKCVFTATNEFVCLVHVTERQRYMDIISDTLLNKKKAIYEALCADILGVEEPQVSEADVERQLANVEQAKKIIATTPPKRTPPKRAKKTGK